MFSFIILWHSHSLTTQARGRWTNQNYPGLPLYWRTKANQLLLFRRETWHLQEPCKKHTYVQLRFTLLRIIRDSSNTKFPHLFRSLSVGWRNSAAREAASCHASTPHGTGSCPTAPLPTTSLLTAWENKHGPNLWVPATYKGDLGASPSWGRSSSGQPYSLFPFANSFKINPSVWKSSFVMGTKWKCACHSKLRGCYSRFTEARESFGSNMRIT